MRNMGETISVAYGIIKQSMEMYQRAYMNEKHGRTHISGIYTNEADKINRENHALKIHAGSIYA